MEFCLVEPQQVTLAVLLACESPERISRMARVGVDIGSKMNNGEFDPEKEYNYGDYEHKLEKSLLKFSGRKRRRFDPQPENLFLDILIQSQPEEPTGSLIIRNLDSDKNCLSGLAGACGGFENFTLDYIVKFISSVDGDFMRFAGDTKIKQFDLAGTATMVGVDIPFSFKESMEPKWKDYNAHFNLI